MRGSLTLIQGDAEATYKEHPVEVARRALMATARIETGPLADHCRRFAATLPGRRGSLATSPITDFVEEFLPAVLEHGREVGVRERADIHGTYDQAMAEAIERAEGRRESEPTATPIVLRRQVEPWERA